MMKEFVTVKKFQIAPWSYATANQSLVQVLAACTSALFIEFFKRETHVVFEIKRL